MRADDIVASDVWKQTIDTLEARLWDEFKRADPADSDLLQHISYRREAVRLVVDQMEALMQDKRSINLKGKR